MSRFASIVIAGLAIVGPMSAISTARADAPLDPAEQTYVDTHHDDVCAALDGSPSVDGVMEAGNGIARDGFNPIQAADIINASVSSFCPAHLPLLASIGNAARARGRRPSPPPQVVVPRPGPGAIPWLPAS